MALDTGELKDVTLDEGGQVGVEERGPAARCALDRLRESADDRAVQIVPFTQRGSVAEPRATGEGRIDEPVRPAVQLSLRERPQLDDLHTAGQRVRQRPHRENPREAGEQEAPRRRIQVDGHLDRAQQLRSELDLVDDHHRVAFHEPRGSSLAARKVAASSSNRGTGACAPVAVSLARVDFPDTVTPSTRTTRVSSSASRTSVSARRRTRSLRGVVRQRMPPRRRSVGK